MNEIFRLLRELGWVETEAGATAHFESSAGDRTVLVVPKLGWWALGTHDDQGEYVHLEDGSSLEDLVSALQKHGVGMNQPKGGVTKR